MIDKIIYLDFLTDKAKSTVIDIMERLGWVVERHGQYYLVTLPGADVYLIDFLDIAECLTIIHH